MAGRQAKFCKLAAQVGAVKAAIGHEIGVVREAKRPAKDSCGAVLEERVWSYTWTT